MKIWKTQKTKTYHFPQKKNLCFLFSRKKQLLKIGTNKPQITKNFVAYGIWQIGLGTMRLRKKCR